MVLPAGLLLHVEVLVVVAACAAATWWQASRALGGNGLSWFYTFEWPVFAGIALAAWWHLIHEDPRLGRRGSASGGGRPGPTPGGMVTPGQRPAIGADRTGDAAARPAAEASGEPDSVDPGGRAMQGRRGQTVSRPSTTGHGSAGDRVFKWVAAVAGACLVGFVVFVVVRGPSHPTGGGTAALKAARPRRSRPGRPPRRSRSPRSAAAIR